MLEVQRGVVVGLADIGEERGEAQPAVVVVDAGASQWHRDLVGVGKRGGSEGLELWMLHEIGEVTGEAKLLGELIGDGSREVVVEPVIINARGADTRAVRGRGTYIKIGEAAYIVAGGVPHCCIASAERLPLQTCTVVEVEHRQDVPVVSSVDSELVFMTHIILRRVLVVVVEDR